MSLVWIDYKELQNVNFLQSDDEEDNVEFSMINSNLLALDLEDSDGVNSAIVLSIFTLYFLMNSLLLPNEQFCEICSQLNEFQQLLFNFIMQHTLLCKLVEKNN